MRVRKPVVAGLFYEANKERLIKQLEEAFAKGPGVKPVTSKEYGEKIAGIVVPHAGYVYSGYIAAFGYAELARNGVPDTVVLLGPNHHGVGVPIAVSEADVWETPLGSVKVDKDSAKQLIEKSGILAFDESAHRYEHSLEVQLPFLQFIFGDDFKIVPVTMYLQNLEASRILGRALAKLIKESGLKAYVVASSDFTHYEEAGKAAEKDKAAIDAIIRLDERELYDVVIERDATICGYGAIMALISASKELGARNARLLRYANSGDVTGDYSSVVGYASLAFLRC